MTTEAKPKAGLEDVVAATSAIAIAVYVACGVRLEMMPFTPERVVRELDALEVVLV